MTKILSKIITISLYVLMGVSAVLALVFYGGSDIPGTEGTPMREPVVTDTILTWAFILVGVAIVAALIFPLITMVLNPKNAKKTLIGLGVIVVVVFIAWVFSSDEVLQLATDHKDNVPQVLKFAGTQLGTMYTLLGLAILSIFFTEIRSFFK